MFTSAALLTTVWGSEFDSARFEQKSAELTSSFDGRVGACVQVASRIACTRPDERFAMQSVMKLLVGAAVLDAVDSRVWNLDEALLIQKSDLSLYVQPLAKLVGESGFRTTIGDLVRRAIIDSDSAATDILIAKLGGPSAVQSILKRKGIHGIRLDRDERHLQTEIAGITWRPEYVDPAVLDRAIASVPALQRGQAYEKYQTDPRDTATPRGMTGFLLELATGKLLSPSSTAFLMQAMKECATFPERLKAGAGPGWQVAHKTGTSGSWNRITAATNDVGILTAPDGTQVAIAVFVADSRADSSARSAIIAKICAAVVAGFR